MSICQLAENLLQFLTREEQAIRDLQCLYSMFSELQMLKSSLLLLLVMPLFIIYLPSAENSL